MRGHQGHQGRYESLSSVCMPRFQPRAISTIRASLGHRRNQLRAPDTCWCIRDPSTCSLFWWSLCRSSSPDFYIQLVPYVLNAIQSAIRRKTGKGGHIAIEWRTEGLKSWKAWPTIPSNPKYRTQHPIQYQVQWSNCHAYRVQFQCIKTIDCLQWEGYFSSCFLIFSREASLPSIPVLIIATVLYFDKSPRTISTSDFAHFKACDHR